MSAIAQDWFGLCAVNLLKFCGRRINRQHNLSFDAIIFDLTKLSEKDKSRLCFLYMGLLASRLKKYHVCCTVQDQSLV